MQIYKDAKQAPTTDIEFYIAIEKADIQSPEKETNKTYQTFFKSQKVIHNNKSKKLKITLDRKKQKQEETIPEL